MAAKYSRCSSEDSSFWPADGAAKERLSSVCEFPSSWVFSDLKLEEEHEEDKEEKVYGFSDSEQLEKHLDDSLHFVLICSFWPENRHVAFLTDPERENHNSYLYLDYIVVQMGNRPAYTLFS